ncbi:pectate lyase [Novosphingobium endophyticum]|uniref:Pectate lyase n=2 Tax=Novosphingobium endophyticum TaxID=1955250 RepID=A0A916TRS5_9SPHN|nr:pectate lyase [Novosphingobium endophyticum]
MRVRRARVVMRISALTAGLLLISQPVPAKVVGQMVPADPITEARIRDLAAPERQKWLDYFARSRALMAADKAALAAEREGKPAPAGPANGPSGGDGMPLDRPADWYGSAEARQVADNIVSFQTPTGGWGKNQDRTAARRVPGQSYVPVENRPANATGDIRSMDAGWHFVGTIDNGATITELRFLARVQARLPGPDGNAYRAAFLKGVRYLLTAQFPNGGWPQVFPLQGGYHDALTYNDRAVSRTAMLMLDIAGRKGDFAFVPPLLAAEVDKAAVRARDVILATQVVVNGERTIWGQQYDALTLTPAGARNFEPAALSTDESVDLLLFLMKQPHQTPEVASAIDSGVAWLRKHALMEVEWPNRPDGPQGRRLIAKSGAGPIWSRFYDVRTFAPVFGDRDRTIHDDVNDLSIERRNGYSWFGTSPLKLFHEYDRWQQQ